MADYSQYQGPSAEWVELTKTTVVPAAGPAPGQSIEDYQKAANAGREKASALSMEKLGEYLNPLFALCIYRCMLNYQFRFDSLRPPHQSITERLSSSYS